MKRVVLTHISLHWALTATSITTWWTVLSSTIHSAWATFAAASTTATHASFIFRTTSNEELNDPDDGVEPPSPHEPKDSTGVGDPNPEVADQQVEEGLEAVHVDDGEVTEVGIAPGQQLYEEKEAGLGDTRHKDDHFEPELGEGLVFEVPHVIDVRFRVREDQDDPSHPPGGCDQKWAQKCEPSLRPPQVVDCVNPLLLVVLRPRKPEVELVKAHWGNVILILTSHSFALSPVSSIRAAAILSTSTRSTSWTSTTTGCSILSSWSWSPTATT